MRITRLTRGMAVLLLSIALVSCGNSSTDPGDETAPEIPSVENGQPDFSHFENNGTAGKSNNGNFTEAKQLVTGFQAISNLSKGYDVFLEPAVDVEPSFKDGTWTWVYENQVFMFFTKEIRLQARRMSGFVEWVLFWTFDDGIKIVDNYRLMEGTTGDNGNEGNWNFNVLQPETTEPVPALEAEWDSSPDGTEATITLKIIRSDDSNIDITYLKEEPAHRLNVFFNNSSPDVEIFWDTEADIGFIDFENEPRRCWTTSSDPPMDVECPPEIGFRPAG